MKVKYKRFILALITVLLISVVVDTIMNIISDNVTPILTFKDIVITILSGILLLILGVFDTVEEKKEN